MDVDESNLTQQMHEGMGGEPLSESTTMPPLTVSTSPAVDTGTDIFSFGKHFRKMSESEHVPILLTCALYLLLVKLKEMGASSSTADLATTSEGNLNFICFDSFLFSYMY